MATFDYKGRSIYYDVQGEGKPILILNGIMMSTKSWEPFVSSFSDKNMFIRLDFIDQGQSDRLTNSLYMQELQVEIIMTLLHELNLAKVNVVGISYGGEIAVKLAYLHPHVIDRLVLFNTTSYTSPWLAEIGHSWINIGKTRNGQNYYQATIPIIYSPSFYEKRLDWMKKREAYLIPIFSNPEFLDAMERLTLSAESYDAREYLSKITAPTLIVSGDEDYLTPLADQKKLHQAIKGSYHVILPGVGHASMYEVPMLFVTIVLGFINAKDITYTV
ncbi:MAG: alpha/beta hydrolase [Acholeplasmataceae bacterium]